MTLARERTQEIRETAEQWEVTEPGGTVQSAPGGIYVRRAIDGREVARLAAHYLGSRDERRNVARLIAAAPELLAAAKGALAAANELMTEFVSKQRAANWGVINDGLYKCEQAIRKAEGRQVQP